jgi:hypothetical protein
MSRSQTVSTISSTEYIIQSLNLSFVHYNLTYVQRWTLSSAPCNRSSMGAWHTFGWRQRALEPLCYLSTSRGKHEVKCFHSFVPPFTYQITRHVPKKSSDTSILMITQGSCVQLFPSRADTQRGVGVAYGHPQRVVSSYASSVCLARASDHFDVATIALLDSNI